MRRSVLWTCLILVGLALSSGAIAYPALVGPRAPANGTASNATAGFPTGPGDGLPEMATSPRLPVEWNESENGTRGPAVVEHNVTVTLTNETIWVNGTLLVVVGNQTVVNVTFSLEVRPGEGVNVTFNGTVLAEGVGVHVNGSAFILPRAKSVTVQVTLEILRDGEVIRSRDFACQMTWLDSDRVQLLVEPLPDVSFGLRLDSP